MALDEVILTSEAVLPTLRLYSWSHPTVSLGYFQKADNHLATKCRKYGIALVRRSTGGRAVFHDKEITYSICSTYENFPSPHSLKDVYLTISGWLINFFSKIGIKVYLDEKRPERSYIKSKACFLTSTPYELLISGKKICGNAQKRGKKSFLQHGSIPIDIDTRVFSRLMGLDYSRIGMFTSLKNEGCHMDIEELRSIMISEFETTLNCKLQLLEPSASEIMVAEKMKLQFELL